MNTKLLTIGIIIVVLAGGFYFFKSKNMPNVSPASDSPTHRLTDTPTSPSPSPITINEQSDLSAELQKLTPEENTEAFKSLNADIERF